MACHLFESDERPLTIPPEYPKASDHHERIISKKVARTRIDDDFEALDALASQGFIIQTQGFESVETGENKLDPHPLLSPRFQGFQAALKACSMGFKNRTGVLTLAAPLGFE
tara:strand:+ start:800 stop:1135 length:336 start_codon:yes stop_codon:yes gene_type:complete